VRKQGLQQPQFHARVYSVINRKHMSRLKRVVQEKDPSAFVAIMTAEDVTGVEVGNQPHW